MNTLILCAIFQIMLRELLPRLDLNQEYRKKILPYCRLKKGEIWTDSVKGHRVGCLDATLKSDVLKLLDGKKTDLMICDPPYNLALAKKKTSNLFQIDIDEYLKFSKKWVANANEILASDSYFYIWLGADQRAGFQPLPEFILLMRNFKELKSRSFITMRNQRGYGTQKNWMAVRQELLCYVKGNPSFNVIYTDIPKILRGYYKVVGGRKKENLERSKSSNIRPGNVWVDIQQVFYRMEENVPGAVAQKPLKAILRIIRSSSSENDLVVDFFSHSGTTLIACEKLNRCCYIMDNDPVFVELTRRRLEHFRKSGKHGWQCENPF